MIIVMRSGASDIALEKVIARIEELGYTAHVMHGVSRRVIGCLGDERGKSELRSLSLLEGVESVMPILSPYKLAAKQLQNEQTVVTVADNCRFGAGHIPVIAGPCSVESEEQIVEAAKAVKSSGASALRGGAFKPRSSTYSFQGLGEQGLKHLAVAREETGLPIVTEIMDRYMLDLVVKYADVLQVGARNMQNFTLLKSLGQAGKPILLKRSMMATIEEWLLSAEYILAAGNPNVILCERGIRTFETATRNTLDLNCIPALRERTHLPIVVDPSHATGVWSYVTPMAKAAVAAGCDGLIIEVHPNPEKAWSDGGQSLKPKVFDKLMNELGPIARAVGRDMTETRPHLSGDETSRNCL